MSTTPKTTREQAREHIVRALRLLLEPGQVVELRAIEATLTGDRRPGVVFGYFDWEHLDAMALAATEEIRSAEGIYFTINPVTPALLARASNRLVRAAGKRASATSDHDILRRRWLVFDLDPDRPSGISSSAEELDASGRTADRIRETLLSEGWPEPVSACSGNGHHLLYRVDLPNTDYSRSLLEACLKGAAVRFSGDGVKIDTSVFNAARIFKLYGTLACKGDHTADRPHRYSKILVEPNCIVVVGEETLRQLAAAAPQTEPARAQAAARTRIPGLKSLDLEGWLAEHAVQVGEARPWEGGRKWEIAVCPFNPDHTGGSAYVGQLQSGAIVAGCQHESCNWGWRDLRLQYEPGYYDRREQARGEAAASVASPARSEPDTVARPQGGATTATAEAGSQGWTAEEIDALTAPRKAPLVRLHPPRVPEDSPDLRLGSHLDDLLGGGLEAGDVVTIGALSAGGGKTALLGQIADMICISNINGLIDNADIVPVLFASEQKRSDLLLRSVSRLSGISGRGLRERAPLTAEELESLQSAISWAREIARTLDVVPLRELAGGTDLATWPLASQVHRLRSRFERSGLRVPVVAVMIDPIHRLAPVGDDMSAIDSALRQAAAVAQGCGAIVLASSDTTKEEARGSTAPPEDMWEVFARSVSCLRGSYALVHVPDAALALLSGPRDGWTPPHFDDDGVSDQERSLALGNATRIVAVAAAKTRWADSLRNPPLLAFDGACSRFSPLGRAGPGAPPMGKFPKHEGAVRSTKDRRG